INQDYFGRSHVKMHNNFISEVVVELISELCSTKFFFMKVKSFVFVMILMTAMLVVVGQVQARSERTYVQSQQTEKEKVKKEDLPTAAIKTLGGDPYKGWTIVQVYRFKGKDAQGKE